MHLQMVRGGMHHYVTEQLGQAIAAGELVQGQQIVPEDLGAQLGVSRTVIREALRVLMAKGMVTASPRSGTRVTAIDQWSLLDPDVILWRVNGPQRDEQLRDLTALRGAIEPLAARGSAEHASGDDLADLGSSCADMEAAVAAGDLAAFTSADLRFHRTVLASSGNLIYRQFARPIEAVLMARQSLDMLPPTLKSRVLTDHRSIMAAIEARDGDRAEAVTRGMVEIARDEIFAEIERRQAD